MCSLILTLLTSHAPVCSNPLFTLPIEAMVLKRAKQKGISFGYCDTKTGQRVYPPPPVSEMTDLLPEQQPPEQTPAFYLNSKLSERSEEEEGDMYVKVTCSPNLGQAARISRHESSVKFVVLLETSSPSLVDQEEGGEERPQVCLWHNHNGHFDWAELALKPTR
jgi:hypothetical protein